jgi:Zn-dependent peptidase ImmA (M78 family)/transcriptional regulator with XRE-family HTH domain
MIVPSEATRPRVNSEAIILAREIRGLTQSELAVRLNVSQGTISKLEDGLLRISDADLDALAKMLGLRRSFFFRDDLTRFSINWLYRKKATLPQKTLVQINARICLRLAQIERLLRKTEITAQPLPCCDPDEYKGGPAEIAAHMRCFLGVPPGPVKDLIDFLENTGIVVVEDDFGTLRLDGVSAFARQGTPAIFLNSALPRSRRVFTAVHELGHLVMHRVPRPDAEQESNEFTAEFLLPKEQIRPDFRNCGTINIDTLSRLKLKWRVSIGALLKRALMLGFVDQGRFAYLRAMMSKAGFHRDEPHEHVLGSRPPSLENELISIHIEKLGYNLEELCELLDVADLDEFLGPGGISLKTAQSADFRVVK